jgi:hypothetical protein
MKALLIHAVLLASLTGVAALFASAQETTDATEEDKRAEEEVRRLNVRRKPSFSPQGSENIGAFVVR